MTFGAALADLPPLPAHRRRTDVARLWPWKLVSNFRPYFNAIVEMPPASLLNGDAVYVVITVAGHRHSPQLAERAPMRARLHRLRERKSSGDEPARLR